MGCGCREKAVRTLEPLCAAIEREGAMLPVMVERTALGVRFQVTHGGLMLDLYDAIKSFRCRGATSRSIENMERSAATYAQLAAHLVGQTTTLGTIARLK